MKLDEMNIFLAAINSVNTTERLQAINKKAILFYSSRKP